MSKTVSLPKNVIEAIKVVELVGVDPANIQMATNTLCSKGFGIASDWILDNKETYLAALSNGYVEAASPVIHPPVVPAQEPVIAGDTDANPVTEALPVTTETLPVTGTDAGEMEAHKTRKPRKTE